MELLHRGLRQPEPRLDYTSTQNDNGSFSLTDYDQANGAAWNSYIAGYDSQNRLDYTYTYNGDGSFSATDYDQANGAAWNSFAAGYDSQNHRDYTYNDTGVVGKSEPSAMPSAEGSIVIVSGADDTKGVGAASLSTPSDNAHGSPALSAPSNPAANLEE